MRSNTIPGFGLCTAIFFIACSQNRDRDQQNAARADAGATATERPTPFDKGPVKIALVQYSGAGDYFEQWTKGARQQADAIGFTMQLYDARADDARQAADLKTAIESRVAGIIVDHGRSSTMCPLINQAADAGIAVVVYDVKVAECAPKAVETAQNDADLATLVLTQMAKDIGDGVPVGYVNPFVIAPLERRDVVWKQFLAAHKWDQKFAVGKFSHTVAADNARLAADALKAHPGVKAVFAPYDELTKGTVSAIEQNKLGSKVSAYGIDISNADIELMTKKGSPWKATATTDPSAVGAAVTRTLALQLAGQLGSKQVGFPVSWLPSPSC
jgi:simple sugar transport system substrate-binding protein